MSSGEVKFRLLDAVAEASFDEISQAVTDSLVSTGSVPTPYGENAADNSWLVAPEIADRLSQLGIPTNIEDAVVPKVAPPEEFLGIKGILRVVNTRELSPFIDPDSEEEPVRIERYLDRIMHNYVVARPGTKDECVIEPFYQAFVPPENRHGNLPHVIAGSRDSIRRAMREYGQSEEVNLSIWLTEDERELTIHELLHLPY